MRVFLWGPLINGYHPTPKKHAATDETVLRRHGETVPDGYNMLCLFAFRLVGDALHLGGDNVGVAEHLVVDKGHVVVEGEDVRHGGG